MEQRILNVGLDIETLSTLPTAAIIAIAARVFVMERDDLLYTGFKSVVNGTSSILAGYHVEPDTCEWWAGQSDSAKEAVAGRFQNPTTIHKALEDFTDWLERMKEQYQCDTVQLWMEGTDFDGAIIRYALRKEFPEKGRKAIPWGHRQLRDARTFILEGLRLLHGELPDDPFSLIPQPEKPFQHHDPLGDVDQMVWNIQYVNKELSEKLKA